MYNTYVIISYVGHLSCAFFLLQQKFSCESNWKNYIFKEVPVFGNTAFYKHGPAVAAHSLLLKRCPILGGDQSSRLLLTIMASPPVS